MTAKAPDNRGWFLDGNIGVTVMHIIDSHFHWWPRSVFEKLCKRTGLPFRSNVNKTRRLQPCAADADEAHPRRAGKEWHDLDDQLAHMDGLGHQVDVVCSIGRCRFSSQQLSGRRRGRDPGHALERGNGRRAARISRPRVWASAAYSGRYEDRASGRSGASRSGKLGLMGVVNIPGSIGSRCTHRCGTARALSMRGSPNSACRCSCIRPTPYFSRYARRL